MQFPVSRRRKPGAARLAALGTAIVVSAVLGMGSSHAQAAGPSSASDRFPNVVLETHEGDVVRFYDDLIKDKIVLINFMYATCEER